MDPSMDLREAALRMDEVRRYGRGEQGRRRGVAMALMGAAMVVPPVAFVVAITFAGPDVPGIAVALLAAIVPAGVAMASISRNLWNLFAYVEPPRFRYALLWNLIAAVLFVVGLGGIWWSVVLMEPTSLLGGAFLIALASLVGLAAGTFRRRKGEFAWGFFQWGVAILALVIPAALFGGSSPGILMLAPVAPFLIVGLVLVIVGLSAGRRNPEVAPA